MEKDSSLTVSGEFLVVDLHTSKSFERLVVSESQQSAVTDPNRILTVVVDDGKRDGGGVPAPNPKDQKDRPWYMQKWDHTELLFDTYISAIGLTTKPGGAVPVPVFRFPFQQHSSTALIDAVLRFCVRSGVVDHNRPTATKYRIKNSQN